jgi:hypothetical protein
MGTKTVLFRGFLLFAASLSATGLAMGLRTSGIASGASSPIEVSSTDLCKALPEKLASTLMAKPGSCSDGPVKASPGYFFCQYGSLLLGYHYIILLQRHFSINRSGEIPWANAFTAEYGGVGDPGISLPKGVGSYAIAFYVTSGTRTQYESSWVNGAYAYNLQIYTHTMTQASALRAMRLIAKITP